MIVSYLVNINNCELISKVNMTLFWVGTETPFAVKRKAKKIRRNVDMNE